MEDYTKFSELLEKSRDEQRKLFMRLGYKTIHLGNVIIADYTS